eukprot:scaffold56562_cov53-Attheya_sp.AAC.1
MASLKSLQFLAPPHHGGRLLATVTRSARSYHTAKHYLVSRSFAPVQAVPRETSSSIHETFDKSPHLFRGIQLEKKWFSTATGGDDNLANSADGESSKGSPFAGSAAPKQGQRAGKARSRARRMVPRKAPVLLTENARTMFQKLLASITSEKNVGIILNYTQSSTGEPRMVYSFDLVTQADLTPDDECVSLELIEDKYGNLVPKLPADSLNDGLKKLYVHHNGFMKVLGATLDVEIDPESGMFTPKLVDREGNDMDPNA